MLKNLKRKRHSRGMYPFLLRTVTVLITRIHPQGLRMMVYFRTDYSLNLQDIPNENGPWFRGVNHWVCDS
jgi:hypothetical protein